MAYGVSIIIPVYNGSNYLREAIDSALAQTYVNKEIIVVNDGSDDNGATRNIALSYGNKIRYYEKRNGGVATALNLGIKEMKGDFFSWLSHDDVYLPDKIEKEVAVLKSHEDIVYSGRYILEMKTKEILACDEWDRISSNIMETGAFLPFFGFVSGCSLLIPKKILIEYNGFDERYRGVQDYKSWFMMFRGKRVRYLQDRLIITRCHDEQGSNTYNKIREEESWLYEWMARELKESDIQGSNMSLYQTLCAYIMRLYKSGHDEGIRVAYRRIIELCEPSGIEQKITEFKNKFNLNNRNGLYLYCAGRRGKMLLLSLKMRDVSVAFFSDSSPEKWGKEFDGVLCVSPNEIPKEATVIATKLWPEEIVEFLRKRGHIYVYSMQDLLNDLLLTPMYKKNIIEWGRKWMMGNE